MKLNLTTFSLTALLLTSSISVLAEDAKTDFALESLNDYSQFSISLIDDQQLSTMRAQGSLQPEVDTGVILWDEVDHDSKPKTHHFGNDGVITITVE